MWGASSPFRSAGALATLSITRMSSQRYLPHYPAIHSEAPRKVPAQRRQLMIIWRLAFAQSGVNRPARKSALAAQIAAVPIGSAWTNILGRSSLDGTARW